MLGGGGGGGGEAKMSLWNLKLEVEFWGSESNRSEYGYSAKFSWRFAKRESDVET